jgi:hypothetical protein
MGQQASGRPGADNGDIVKGLIAFGQFTIWIASMRNGVQVPTGTGPAILTIER